MEQLCVSLEATPETEGQTVDVKFSLKNVDTNVTDNYNFPDLFTDSSKCFEFPVPKDATKYSVSLSMMTNDQEEVFHSSEVEVRSSSLLTLIQTDKPMYKPGQTVKFRILTLQHNMRARVGKISLVSIKNPSDVRVRQWKDINADQGLVSLDMQLSEEPILGPWAIVATIDGVETSQTFKVEEYVLPKFEVTITPPSYLLVTSPMIEGKVCAQYTYGKPVKGTVEMSVCVKSGYRYSYHEERPCVHIIAEIDGCYDFSVNSSVIHLNWRRYNSWGNELVINATVTESGTGIEIYGINKGPGIEFRPLNLHMEDDTNSYFKPGIPYKGRVVVTYPDGSPAFGQKIEVTTSQWNSDLRVGKNFTTDENGIVTYSISNLTTDLNHISLRSRAFEFEQAPYHYNNSYHQLQTPRGYHSIRQWYSPSRSYIHINQPMGEVRTGSQLDLDVYYTTPEATHYTFYYIVKSRGKTVHSGHHKHHFKRHDAPLFSTNSETELLQLPEPTLPPPSPLPPTPSTEEDIVMSDHISKLTLTIPITSEMIHKSQIIVYYVREDGETVASTVEFDVEERFENEVSMNFDENSVYPGSPATLRITADPGSLCSVGVVDKSITLLGGSNQLTPKQVFEKLQSIDREPYYHYGLEDREYCAKKESGGIQRYHYYRTEGVDAIQAFRTMGLHVFTNLRVQTRKCVLQGPQAFYFRTGGGRGLPGSNGVEVVSTKTTYDEAPQQPRAKTVSLRSHFPETWLWDLEIIGKTGELTIVKDIPHTITEWVGNSLCTNPETGVGLSSITSIKAFQPFFLMFNLPYSAVRGETIPIQISIFNYLSECLVMLVSLEENESVVLSDSERSITVCVCGGESETVTFYIAPIELGEIDILASAESLEDNGICSNTVSEDGVGVSDAVKRQIIIEAEGVEQQYTVSDYVCTQGGEVTKTFDLNLEESESEPLVFGSERGFINIIGDIMGPALNNLDNLVRMPYGCGEQNMASFSPNIFVLQYLYNTNQITDKIKADALRYMMAGYQRQLNYRHNDGSYSAFGGGDESGSTWLSAFVVKCLGQSQAYINIDEKDLTNTLNWFHLKQLENGCIPQIGSVHSKHLKGGLADESNEVALTAFTVIAFLEAGVPRDDPSVQEAMNCLNAQGLTDTYTLAVVAYANALFRPGSKVSLAVLQKLLEKAQRDGQMMHWSRNEEQKPTPSPRWSYWYYRAPSAEVEMTAYALLAMLTNEDHTNETIVDDAMPVVLWLTKQRNPWGGFSSTQDTVIALQALAKYATFTYKGDMHVNITVSGTDVNSNFLVASDNSLLLQSEVIPTIPNQLQFMLSGVGCALIQANVRYNVERLQEVQPSFDIKLDVFRSKTKINDCARRTLKVCTRYLGEDGKSNMAIVDVKMVTGWNPVKSTIKELLDKKNTGITKFEIDKDYVHFYFNELDGIRRCFYFDVEQNLEVTNVKPARAIVYDYYETDLTVTYPYEIATTCGTKEELPFISEEEYEIGIASGEIFQMRQPSGPRGAQAPITCPICVKDDVVATSSYKDMICSYNFVYKSLVGRSGNFQIKVKADVKPVNKKVIDKFFKHQIDSSCECNLLNITVDGTKALIFTDVDLFNTESETFKLDDQTKIMKWTSDLEKVIRKKRCPANP
ncbi:hypothetical protein ScPMuIL_018286 [Solemya velum]